MTTIFTTLLALDRALVDWLLHVVPTTDADRAVIRQVSALRADLDQALNDLVQHRLELAAGRMPREEARLAAAGEQMKTVARTIETAQEVVSIAGTAVEVAAKALSFVGV